MKVVMRQQITGARNGEEWPAPGGIIEIPDEDEARSLVSNGYARFLNPADEEVVEDAEAADAGTGTTEGDAGSSSEGDGEPGTTAGDAGAGGVEGADAVKPRARKAARKAPRKPKAPRKASK